MKKTVILVFTFMLLVCLSAGAWASDEIKVFVNGNKVNFPDQKPLINADNRTMVPVRFVSQALGAKVEWIDSTRTVKINQDGTLITLVIGENKATVGQKVVKFDTIPDIINNRTMVPLRFVSEALGAKVVWDGETRTINITTKTTSNTDKTVEQVVERLKNNPPEGVEFKDNRAVPNLSSNFTLATDLFVKSDAKYQAVRDLYIPIFGEENVEEAIAHAKTKTEIDQTLDAKIFKLDNGRRLQVSSGYYDKFVHFYDVRPY